MSITEDNNTLSIEEDVCTTENATTLSGEHCEAKYIPNRIDESPDSCSNDEDGCSASQTVELESSSTCKSFQENSASNNMEGDSAIESGASSSSGVLTDVTPFSTLSNTEDTAESSQTQEEAEETVCPEDSTLEGPDDEDEADTVGTTSTPAHKPEALQIEMNEGTPEFIPATPRPTSLQMPGGLVYPAPPPPPHQLLTVDPGMGPYPIYIAGGGLGLNSRGSSPQSHQSMSPPVNVPLAAPANSGSTGGGAVGEHYVMVHVNAGETFSVRVGDQIQHIPGPATVRMVSNNGPPMPMPMQVPPGHLVQQIVDENGILTHVILSPYPAGPPGMPSPNMPPMPCPPPPMPPHSGPGGYCSPNGTMGMYPGQYPYAGGYGQFPGYGMVGGGHMHPGHQCNGPHHPSGMEDRGGMGDRSGGGKTRMPARMTKRHQQHPHHGPHHRDNYHPPYNSGPPPYSSYRRKRGQMNGNVRRSDVPSSSSGEENTMDDEERRTIKELLNSMPPPQVSDVEARSALIQLFPPEMAFDCALELDPADANFELFLTESDPDGRYNCVFHGEATEICLQDLKPASSYHVKACAVYDGIHGDWSCPVSFTTGACEPASPRPPTLTARTRNTLNLRWGPPSADHGAKVTGCVLEWKSNEAEPREFTEIYAGNQRYYKMTKLQPATEYWFRLAAVNSHGQSSWSDPVSMCTSGTAPTQPEAPRLTRQHVHALGLAWTRRATDDSFVLQMEDEATGHGFVPVFNGPELSHHVENLRRNTRYRFRLAAANEEGSSKWSEVVAYATLPAEPGPPTKLQVKGKLEPTRFTVRWESPDDDGGAPVKFYRLEMDQSPDDGSPISHSNSKSDKASLDWRNVYEGATTECLCAGLQAGSRVQVRVRCQSAGGWGPSSQPPLRLLLPAYPPGRCPRPQVLGRPRTNSVHLAWEKPESDGGAPVSGFEVSQESRTQSMSSQSEDCPSQEADPDPAIVYTGTALDCWISGLQSGGVYLYRVRATNRAGQGEWSEPLQAASGAGVPEAPTLPMVVCKSAHTALVTWEATKANGGASVTEYRLEWKQKNEQDFTVVFTGDALQHELRNLMPATTYSFRVSCVNVAGPSSASPVAQCTTPASSPGQLTTFRSLTICPTTARLTWKEPSSHGSPITGYVIDVGDGRPMINVSVDVTELTVEALLPETTYKIRIQATNAVGAGQFSNPVKVTTQSLPPGPPRLECVQTQAQSIRLRWGDGRNPEVVRYILEMSKQPDQGWQVIYTGPSHTHKVSRLSECCEYFFRVHAANEAGSGEHSSLLQCSTTKAAPPAVRAPKVTELTTDSCRVEWYPLRPMGQDGISYILQLLAVNGPDADYRQVYRGSDTSCQLTCLLPGTEYLVRVCGARSSSAEEIVGAYSPGVAFTTRSLGGGLSLGLSSTPTGHSWSLVDLRQLLRWPGPLTDQHRAVIILAGFALVVGLIAYLVQRLLINEA